jgi:glyoxylase-like metal-dependent hydrolase (beta-lactamase superfamily II)
MFSSSNLRNLLSQVSLVVLAASSFTFVSADAVARQPSAAQTAASLIEIGRFDVPGPGSVNTYWIHSSKGWVLIDFQRDTASARKAIAQIKSTGKPVAAMLLTHAHPDHIGGIDEFQKAFPNVPLYASQATVDEMKSDTLGYQKSGPAFLKELAPERYPLPNIILKNRDTLRIGDLTILVREWGASESPSATVFYLPQHKKLFTGDLVGNKVTDFLLGQGTGDWIKQLRQLPTSYPNATTIYPGHGAPGSARELMREQRKYLETFRAYVATQMKAGHWDGKELSAEGRKKVADAMATRYIGYVDVAPLPKLNELNANAVAQELSKSHGK